MKIKYNIIKNRLKHNKTKMNKKFMKLYNKMNRKPHNINFKYKNNKKYKFNNYNNNLKIKIKKNNQNY